LDSIIEEFFTRLSNTPSRLLMLDFDGTISPFRAERDKAFPYEGVAERLEILIRSRRTRVIIISGRAIGDIKPLLRLSHYPEIWGSHGWEHLDGDGNYTVKKPAERFTRGLKKAHDFILHNNLKQYLEEKPVSLAVHYRGVDEDKRIEIRQIILHNWKELADEFSLVYSEFDGGVELKIPGFNKGDVIRAILTDLPPVAAMAYLGDDLTDEDAFKAMPDSGLSVLVRKHDRPTAAQTRITPPGELIEFLDKWLEVESDAGT
jgi:trehalose 6-phosphate phosphatase